MGSSSAAHRTSSVIRTQAVPLIQLDALLSQLYRPRTRQMGKHRVERLFLGYACLEGFLALEAGGYLQSLTAVLAQAREDADEEVGVGNRMADLERGVPGRQQVQVVLIQAGDRALVMERELPVGKIVNPCAHHLADELPAGLAADGVGDHSDRVVRLDEAEWHCRHFRGRGGRNFSIRPRGPPRPARA